MVLPFGWAIVWTIAAVVPVRRPLGDAIDALLQKDGQFVSTIVEPIVAGVAAIEEWLDVRDVVLIVAGVEQKSFLALQEATAASACRRILCRPRPSAPTTLSTPSDRLRSTNSSSSLRQ